MSFDSIRRATMLSLIAAGVTAVAINAQTPAPVAKPAEPTQIAPTTPDYGNRPVALIYGDMAITRSDLAEFLIARGGYEKVELLVNKKIIEIEAAKKKVTVSNAEMEKALLDDIKGLEISRDQFVEVVLSKYGKSYFEWMEDVIRPRLLLAKMCEQDVKVTDDDLKIEFDRQFGEKRKVQIIIWPKQDSLKGITKVWDDIRKDAAEFDRIAKQQANPSLASTAGHVSPISRNLVADDRIIEEKAFSMKEGDVSEIFMTTQGYMVMKCLQHIPANTTVKFDIEKVKMKDAMFQIKLSKEIPKYFETLKKKAAPNMLLSGPPSEWQLQKANREKAEDVLKTGGQK
ncbi:hypothetical protein BH11PLA2_BH11PLA2_51470 [soil metagenome]